MSFTKTYREELQNMSIIEKDGETQVSNFIVTMYRFMFWLTSKANRQPGYINKISNNCNNGDTIDIMMVTTNIINDNINIIILKKEDKDKLVTLKKYFDLILTHLDDTIRTNFRVLYPEEQDDEDPMLKCDMLSECNALLNDILSPNEEDKKEKN